MKKTPRIIFKSKFTYGYNNPDNIAKKNLPKEEYYKEQLTQNILNMTDYYANQEKRVVSMISYYMGSRQEQNVNMVLENGKYATEKDVKKLEKDFIKATDNSNLWQGILSFDNDWLNQKIEIKELEQLIAKEVLPKFLKKCGFEDMKKMRYCFSLHGNTDNIHIHFAFVELAPNYRNRDGKLMYRRKGQLTEEEKNFIKNETLIAIERKTLVTPKIIELNQDIEHLKTFFNPKEKNFILRDSQNLLLEEKIIRLGLLVQQYRGLDKSKKVKYGSIKDNVIGKEIKRLTKDIRKSLFQDKTSELYHGQEEVKESLKKLNDLYKKLNEENHIETKVKNNELVLTKKKYIDSYVMNSIINHALFRTNQIQNIVKTRSTKEKITVDDLLQEVAYQNAKKLSQENIKVQILDNYFYNSDMKNRYKYNYEMKRAVKHINDEMEQSIKDFHELFEDNTYEKRRN